MFYKQKFYKSEQVMAIIIFCKWMCGFCLAENFKYNSEEETILLVKYGSSSGISDLHSEVPIWISGMTLPL